jgi:class 3 adenylate cyclase
MNLFLNIRFRILYADIVNFTPLSEKFTPPELVQILNKLFGKFDQLAQVFIWIYL